MNRIFKVLIIKELYELRYKLYNCIKTLYNWLKSNM